MKTFKQFINEKDKEKDDEYAVLSDVIHFKAGTYHEQAVRS